MSGEKNSGVFTLAKQGSITFVGNIIGKALGFAFVAVATRLVTPAEYGVFTLGLSVVAFVQGIASLNIYKSVDYFVPKLLDEADYGRAKKTIQNVFTIGIVASTFGAVAVFLTREQIATLFNEPQLEVVLALFVLLIPLQTLNRTLLASFNSIKEMKYRVAIRNIANPLTRIVSASVLVLSGAGLLGLVGGYLFGLGVAVLGGIIFLTIEAGWIRNATPVPVSNRDLFSYSLPLVLAGVIYSIIGQIDYFAIGYFLSSDDVGQYRVAYLLSSNLLIVLSAITPVFKPMIAERRSNDSVLESRYQLATRWVTMLTFPLAITLILSPDVFLTVLFTSEYSRASATVVALTVGYLLNASFGPEGMMLEGLGNTRLTLVNTFVLVGVNSLLDVLLIPRFGILGAGIATGSALTIAGLAGVIEIYFLRSIHPYSPRLFRVLTAALLPLVLGQVLVVYLVRIPQTALFLPILVVVTYIIGLRLTNGFTNDDREVASRIDNYFPFPIARLITGPSRK